MTMPKPKKAPQRKAVKKAVKKARPKPRPTRESRLKTLADCRREIDKIDDQLIKLLDRRGRVSRRVGEVKAEKGGDYFDAGRHLQVLRGIGKRGAGDFPRDGLRHVFTEILSSSLNLQAAQTIAFLGPEATFTHIAARGAFGRSPRFTPYPTISDVFLAVEKGWAHFGVTPVENSTGGVIHATLDELVSSDLLICAETYIRIRHSLLCSGPIDKIRRICTHPQILSQCRIWLRENMPGVELIETPSSAEGAKLAQKSKSVATIGPQMASEIYGLPILEEGIEDEKDNITRFLVIGHQSPRPSGSDRTSLMFSIKDEPGALYHLLKPFANRKINMTKIESRPTHLRAWDYIFFVDVEGHISQPEITALVEKLQKHTTYLRVLGSYPVDRPADMER